MKTIYEYSMDGVDHKATIYKTNNKSKKLLLLISGSYQLTLGVYIQKLVNDLKDNLYFHNTTGQYEIVVFEKLDKSSITIYKDVAEYIKSVNSENPLEELIIMGFSAGGVVSSHIMGELKEFTFKKKIITYDTPWQVMDNVLGFANNFIYRPDIIFFNAVYEIYSNHYNINDIRHHLINNPINVINGANELVDIIKNIHNYTHEEMYDVTGFNFNQTDDTKVINIWTTRDPFVNRSTHDDFVTKNADKIKFPVINIKKNVVGHCTDLITKNYLNDILRAIMM
jgi:glutaredoxin